MMLHDEVRERPIALGLIHESKRHPRAIVVVLDANHLGREQQPLFAGQIHLELRDRARPHPLGGTQKQPTSGHVLDEAVDDDPRALALCPDRDRDSHCFPLVHLLKGTLHTHGA